ncbi:hypothetical protein [Paenibacillus sp. NPDC058071]|uniref:hypothetical protein n=1 Tax=Paenibacillus sp. NPDC058071 TaxID=3346326 RepID=UPI0036D84D7B
MKLSRFVAIFTVLFFMLSSTIMGAESNDDSTKEQGIEANNIANLDQIKPVQLSKPPFYYYLSTVIDPNAAANKTKKLTLKQNSVKSIEVAYDEPKEFLDSQYVVPNSFRFIKGNLPAGIPTEYKGQMIVKAIKGDNNVILFYGLNFAENRYVVILDKSMTKVEKVYDFINYAISPKYIQKDYDFIYQQSNWAAVENGILYVSHGHRTYAKSSNGANGFITAIRLSDNRVLWRTSSLVSNSRNFQIVGDVILSGYGFTNEKDYLYQINKKTGKTLEQIALKDGPAYIVKQKNGYLVYGYSHLTSFLIK